MSRRDIMLVENKRLTPCPRPVWDGMWIFGGTFRPAGTVHRGMVCFYQYIVPNGTSEKPPACYNFFISKHEGK
jgi:hypothetical protein